jgi:hypothetical protein
MAISPRTVTESNEAIQGIPLPPARVEELPVELNQLAAAALASRARVDFDVDPTDFRRALARARE